MPNTQRRCTLSTESSNTIPAPTPLQPAFLRGWWREYWTAAALILALLSPAASADWSSGDTNRQLAFTALQLVDWAQTREIARNPDFYETNPILGKYPSSTEVDVYFAATTLGHYLVSRALPSDYRKAWQYVWIGVQAGYVTRNYQVGVRVNF